MKKLLIVFLSVMLTATAVVATTAYATSFDDNVNQLISKYEQMDNDVSGVVNDLKSVIATYEELSEDDKTANSDSFGRIKPLIKEYLQSKVSDFASIVETKGKSEKVVDISAARNLGKTAENEINSYCKYLGAEDKTSVEDAYNTAVRKLQENPLYYFSAFGCNSASLTEKGVTFAQSGRNEGEIFFAYNKPMKLNGTSIIELSLVLDDYCYLGQHNEDNTGRTNNIVITMTDVENGVKGSGNSLSLLFWSLQNDTRICVYATKNDNGTVKSIDHTGALMDVVDPNEMITSKSLGLTFEDFKNEGLQLVITNENLLDYYEILVNDFISMNIMSLIPNDLFGNNDVYLSVASFADDSRMPANNGYLNTITFEKVNDVNFKGIKQDGNKPSTTDPNNPPKNSGCNGCKSDLGAEGIIVLAALSVFAVALLRRKSKENGNKN